MKYTSIEDGFLQNAYRHESKGLWWTEQGFDSRAKGSFRKAAKNYRKAEEWRKAMHIEDPLLRSIVDRMARMVEDSIMNGSNSI